MTASRGPTAAFGSGIAAAPDVGTGELLDEDRARGAALAGARSGGGDVPESERQGQHMFAPVRDVPMPDIEPPEPPPWRPLYGTACR